MKIESINTYVVDAGWRPWQFTEIITDSGITGYGEMSDGRNPWGIVGSVEDFKPLLIGRDPLNIQAIYWDLQRMAIQSKGGISLKNAYFPTIKFPAQNKDAHISITYALMFCMN